jgi:ATP-dependent protease Clp ATPase subunit
VKRLLIGEKAMPTPAQLRCSFCDKPERDVKYLIVRDNVGICEDCVALCNEILQEQGTCGSQARPCADDFICDEKEFDIPR